MTVWRATSGVGPMHNLKWDMVVRSSTRSMKGNVMNGRGKATVCITQNRANYSSQDHLHHNMQYPPTNLSPCRQVMYVKPLSDLPSTPKTQKSQLRLPAKANARFFQVILPFKKLVGRSEPDARSAGDRSVGCLLDGVRRILC